MSETGDTASSGSRPSATSVQGIVEIALRVAAAVSLLVDKATAWAGTPGIRFVEQ